MDMVECIPGKASDKGVDIFDRLEDHTNYHLYKGHKDSTASVWVV